MLLAVEFGLLRNLLILDFKKWEEQTHMTRDFMIPPVDLSSLNHARIFVAVCPLRVFGVVAAASYAIFAYLPADRSLMLRPVSEFDFEFASLAV